MIKITNFVWHKEIKEIEIKSINFAIDHLDNNLAIDIWEKIQSLGPEIQDQFMLL